MTKEELRMRLTRWYTKEPMPCGPGLHCPALKRKDLETEQAHLRRVQWNEEFNQILRDIKEMSI